VIGVEGFFLTGDQAHPAFFFCQWAFACNAATIFGGSVAGRTRFMAYLVVAGFVTAVIYPLPVHWVWGPGGWLQSVGDWGFIDASGGCVVHMLGGVVGLVGALMLGPRLESIPRKSDYFTSTGFESMRPSANSSPRSLVRPAAATESAAAVLAAEPPHVLDEGWSTYAWACGRKLAACRTCCRSSTEGGLQREKDWALEHATNSRGIPAIDPSWGVWGSFCRGLSSPVYPLRDLDGHNRPLFLLGVWLLVVGWPAFNSLSVALYPPSVAETTRSVIVGRCITNTVLALSAAGVAAVMSQRWLSDHYSATQFANSVLGGAVAITAGCSVVPYWASVVIGAISSAIVIYGSRWMKYLWIDDPLDAVPVHAACGLWGTLTVGLFADQRMLAEIQGLLQTTITPLSPQSSGTSVDESVWNSRGYGAFLGGGWSLLAVQLLGSVVILAWTGVCSWAVMGCLQWRGALRATDEGQAGGMDFSKHGGEEAYPEFVSRSQFQRLARTLEQVRTFDQSGDMEEGNNRLYELFRAASMDLTRRSPSVALTGAAETDPGSPEVRVRRYPVRGFGDRGRRYPRRQEDSSSQADDEESSFPGDASSMAAWGLWRPSHSAPDPPAAVLAQLGEGGWTVVPLVHAPSPHSPSASQRKTFSVPARLSEEEHQRSSVPSEGTSSATPPDSHPQEEEEVEGDGGVIANMLAAVRVEA
jgi:ammonia channel protein AmtB